MSDAGADEPVPKLPRGRGLKFSGPELFRILMTLVSLVGVLLLAKPCANSVSNFVMGYQQGSGSSASPRPGTVEPPPAPSNLDQYEQLRPGMTEEEIKAAIERSKAKNAAANRNSAVPPSGAAPAPNDTSSFRRAEPTTGSATTSGAGTTTNPTTTATVRGHAVPPAGSATAPAGSATGSTGSATTTATMKSQAVPAAGSAAAPSPR